MLLALLTACGDNIVERPDAPAPEVPEVWVDGEIIDTPPPVVPCADKHTTGKGLGHLKHCVKK